MPGLSCFTAYAIFLGDAFGKVSCAKIRTMDIEREVGKSNGYRCIVLADNINKCAFLLHVYRHGHGEDENISHSDKNKLKKLVKEYSDSLKARG